MPKRKTPSDKKTRRSDGQELRKRAKKDVPDPPKGARLEVVNEVRQAGGTIYVVGSGDCGQLGLGEDVSEKLRPGPVDLPDSSKAVAVTAGGMHTLALSAKFSLYSWGVNDEAALGRPAGGEAWCRSRYSGPIQQSDTPGLVEMPKDASKCCLLSAGDSHSAVATATGHVYVWGTFRDESGVMGFSPRERFALKPTLVWTPPSPAAQVVEISSGCDHVAARCAGGQVYTWGSGKQGQLGRIGSRINDRSHGILDVLTSPAPMHLPLSLRSKPRGIACGWYCTFVLLSDGSVYACGLNNYGQLGISGANLCFAPRRCAALKGQHVVQVASGAHHTLALCDDGRLLGFGRTTYGRLGVRGVDTTSDAPVREAGAIHVEGLEGHVVGIAAGDATSGCFSDQMCGLFLCGSNNTGMLGKGDDDSDEAEMVRVKRTKGFNEVKVVQLSIGGQHVAMLTVPASSQENGARD